MSMSHEDRAWLEGRLQQLREDNRAMELRLTAEIAELKQTTTVRLNDHSHRIRALEIHRGYVAGIGATLGFFASWIRDLITGKGGSP